MKNGEARQQQPHRSIRCSSWVSRPRLGVHLDVFPAAMTQEGFNSTKHIPKHAAGGGVDFGNLAICSRATLDLHA